MLSPVAQGSAHPWQHQRLSLQRLRRVECQPRAVGCVADPDPAPPHGRVARAALLRKGSRQWVCVPSGAMESGMSLYPERRPAAKFRWKHNREGGCSAAFQHGASARWQRVGGCLAVAWRRYAPIFKNHSCLCRCYLRRKPIWCKADTPHSGWYHCHPSANRRTLVGWPHRCHGRKLLADRNVNTQKLPLLTSNLLAAATPLCPPRYEHHPGFPRH